MTYLLLIAGQNQIIRINIMNLLLERFILLLKIINQLIEHLIQLAKRHRLCFAARQLGLQHSKNDEKVLNEREKFFLVFKKKTITDHRNGLGVKP